MPASEAALEIEERKASSLLDNRGMTNDSYAAILDGLRALYPTTRILPLKETHSEVGHIAHGWYLRVHRSCAALMLLRQAGYGAEAWPTRRAIIEHMLALRWLADNGNEAKDVVRRAHAESSRRRQESAADAGWSSAGWPIWADVAADGAAATGNPTESNMLTNVRLRCEKYGIATDYASWLLETNNSHPGWTTASAYLQETPQTLLGEPRFDDNLDDARFCARRLLRCLVALGDMMTEPPWASEVTDMLVRITRMEKALTLSM